MAKNSSTNMFVLTNNFFLKRSQSTIIDAGMENQSTRVENVAHSSWKTKQQQVDYISRYPGSECGKDRLL
jgi:hypothetical protein